MSYQDVLARFGHDLEGLPEDPPKDDEGQLICARECLDGNQCRQRVGMPGIACLHHDSSDPLLWCY